MGDINISKIKQSKNIRHNADTEELAKSLQQKELLQPILSELWMVILKLLLGIGGFALAKLWDGKRSLVTC